MFYLYIRIYSRSQLMQLEPDFMTGLTGQIGEINRNNGGIPSGGLDGLFRYAALYRETLVRMINAAEQCRNLLDENGEYLDGFNIILTKTEKKDYELQKNMEFLVYQILEEGGVWVDPDCYDALEPYLFLEKETFLYEMTDRKQNDPTSRESLSLILGDGVARDRIIRWLEKSERKALILTGPEGSGRRLNLADGLNCYLGGENRPVVRLKLNGNRDYIYEPFMECLYGDRFLPDMVRENPILRDLLEGKMMSRSSDFFSDDFEKAFLAYLEIRRQKALDRSQTLYLIIERGEDYSDLSKHLLNRILNCEGYRFILLCERNNPSYVPGEMEIDEISFHTPSGENLRKRFEEAFPGTEWGIRMETLEKVEPHNLKSLFFAAWLIDRTGYVKADSDPRSQIVEALQEREKRVLRYIHLGKGLVNRSELTDLLANEEETVSVVSERIDRLIALTLVKETVRGELHSVLDEFSQSTDNEKTAVKHLMGLIRKKEDFHPFRYFSFLEEHEETEEALLSLNVIMNWLINNGFRERAENLIMNPPFYGKNIDEITLDSLQNLLLANRLRLALIKADGELLDELVSNGLLSQVSERGQFADDFYLQLSRYYYCQGNMEQAVHYAKNALFMFQKKGSHLGESLANIELAFAFLGQRKVQMGMDYFEIARRISYQIEDNYTLITAYTFGALTAFLFGNISKAESIIDQTLELAEQNGCRRRIFFLTFLAGRIRFEYGHYREGAELFETCYRLSREIGLDEGGHTARRWTGRCLLYMEKRRDAFRWLDADDSSREGLFFLAEADFMVSLYESALQRLEKAEKMPADRALSFSERDNWCDGFMPLEGRLSSGEIKEDVLTGQIEALHSHILALTGRHSEAQQIYMRRTNQEDYPFKPYSYKYNYIYFTILNVGDIRASGDDHRLAALSKAIERLQSRAGRFDNQHRKLDFLNKNWWNKKIMEEAHRKKFL